MATSYKVLGQSNPAAITLTTLYTVPAATETVVSSLTVTNRAGSAIIYRIAIRPNGASIADSQYLAYNTVIAANSTVAYTLGLTLDATDVISVYASTTDATFQAFGSEIA